MTGCCIDRLWEPKQKASAWTTPSGAAAVSVVGWSCVLGVLGRQSQDAVYKESEAGATGVKDEPQLLAGVIGRAELP